jgi:hypothetical protein
MTLPQTGLGRTIHGIVQASRGTRPDPDDIREILQATLPAFQNDEDLPTDPDPFADAVFFKGNNGKGGGSGGQGRNFDPEATDLTGATNEDSLLSIDLLSGATDKNGDPLAVTRIDGQSIVPNTWFQLQSGAMAMLGSDGTLTYDPADAFDALNDGETAIETLSYTVSDDRGASTTASVSIEISGISDPVAMTTDAIDDTIDALSSEVLTIQVLANDIDAAGAGLQIVAIDGQEILPGAHIHLSSGAEVHVNPDGTISYDPTATAAFTDGATEDAFSYTVRDANGNVDTAIASIRITEVQPDPQPAPDPGPTTDPDVTTPPIEAILAGDSLRLNAGSPYGTPEIVTFAFADSVPYYYPSSSFVYDTFQSFTDQQRIATREVFDQIESFSGLQFVEVAPEDAELILGIADMSGDTLGTAFYPTGDGSGLFDSDVWIDTQVAGEVFEEGTLGYATLIHEIGHAIGLKHPDSQMLSWIEATRQFTVMGYGEHPGAFEDVSSYMSYDIAALQHLYGTNETATAGDDTYSVGNEVRTIWDAGGTDTLDVSGSTTNTVVDLNDGAFSSTGGQDNNIAIAFGATIENAVGSAQNDVIIGNEADNWIDGGAGNDMFTGGAGLDTYAFGTGWGQDTIEDYTVGEDRLDFSGTGLTLEDLLITAANGNTTISDGENSVTLTGIDGTETRLDETFLLF